MRQNSYPEMDWRLEDDMAINVPKNIILHCSASPDHPDKVDRAAIIRYHVDVKGYSDGGYHRYIEDTDGDGNFEILTGRAISTPGAHCVDGGMNYKSIGICFIGGDPWTGFGPAYPMPQKQWEAGVKLCAELCKEYQIPVENIFCHRDFNKGKTCPGIGFDRDGFRSEVKAVLDAVPVLPAETGSGKANEPHPINQLIQNALAAQKRANTAWKELLEIWE